MNTLKATAVTLVLALVMCSPALANPAVGTNPFLPNDGTAGSIYIPLKDLSPFNTSGDLGDLRPDGKQVGLDPDSVVLSGLGDTSSGWVDIELAFDITADRNPLEPIITGGLLALTFHDLDFVEVGTSAFTFSEWLEISYLLDPGDGSSVGTTVRIDGSNYTDFLENPVPPPSTSNTTLTYFVNLKTDLGLSDADLLELSGDNSFGLVLRLGTQLEHLRDRNNTIRNSAEAISTNDFVLFTEVPEPTTLVMLAMGSVALLRRRVG